jgi:hypothetical protein
MASSPFSLHVEFNRIGVVETALNTRTLAHVEKRADRVLDVVHAYEHVITRYMLEHTRRGVGVMRNGVATSTIVSEAGYSAAEELGSVRRPAGHFRITQGVAAAKGGYIDGISGDIGSLVEGAAR